MTRHLLDYLARVLVALLVSACALLAGSAYWASADGSLASTLRWLPALMPAGQTLQAEAVAGSLSAGGHIGRLRWQQGELTVQIDELDLAWDWRSLLDRELRLLKVHAQLLQVQGQAATSSPRQPLTSLDLPLHIQAQVAIDTLDWHGPVQLKASQLKGRYRFDGTQHTLEGGQVRLADGSYQIDGQLQAAAPMAMSLQVNGRAETPVPSIQIPLALRFQALLKGTLSGSEGALDLKIDLQPDAALAARSADTMQATLQATLRPNAEQPLQSAQARWQALDLAVLWPQAPHTRLSGKAQIAPEGASWLGQVQLQNALPGTLNAGRLPLQSLNASLRHRTEPGAGQWQVTRLEAAAAGGTLQAQGNYAGSPTQWAVSAKLQSVDPAKIDSRWPGAPLSGSLSAQPTPQGLAFETRISADLKPGGAEQIQLLSAKGFWNAPTLQLDSLQIQTRSAEASGQLYLDTRTLALSTRLKAVLPGTVLALDGNLSAIAGVGETSVQVSDAGATSRWLARVPLLGARLGDRTLPGPAEIKTKWNGGWQAFTLNMNGKVALGSRQLTLQATAHAKRSTVQTGQWLGSLDTLQAGLQGTDPSAPWTVQLQAPLALEWAGSATTQRLTVASGALRVLGPVPGTTQLNWQPAQWSQSASGPRWQSQGRLQDLPLAWLEVLGQTQLSNLGLRGDLVFGGQWNARQGADGLQLDASLQRTSGDLQLLADDLRNAPLRAGLREASLTLNIARQALTSRLVWASDAAGNASVDFGSRLQNLDGALGWADDAPLTGKMQAKLPRVGAWSLLAPPGWRIQGSLDANATLTGTRSQPQWQGSVEARDLAVRSVVDGIDFSQGVLRLQIQGQHMDIEELTLQGAGGSATGGMLRATGSVDWLAPAAGNGALARLRMVLDAQAQALRVTARPDQRLVLSGNLTTRLDNARLTVRGALRADSALFTLPEDTAPKLGADVVVRRPASVASAGTAARNEAGGRHTRSVQTDVAVTLDLGTNFQVQGYGLSTRLAGQLSLKGSGAEPVPTLTGELRTARGTFKAYGQSLDIEEGNLRFGGVYDNPALNILAIRPNMPQRVGVQISGTAQFPVVRLYADPELPEAEKLSWLVLGRAPSSSGSEAAMLQQAALALLSGKGSGPADGLLSKLGLDELSLGEANSTNADGTTAATTTVKLGKRLSRNFYVAFERSLSGTMNTFYVFYDLSRRLTLRGESGTQNAVDLIFTTRFD